MRAGRTRAVLPKLFAADYWIVLGDVQFNRRDYQHRARTAPLGDPAHHQWLASPTHLPQDRSTLIRDAVIAEPDTVLRRTAGLLRQRYGASPHWPVLAQVQAPVLDAFATGRTATAAEISTRVLLDLLGWKGRILTSSHLPSRPGRSQQLADLAAATGARGYLCGAGGMAYLDQTPFAARNIAVTPFRPPTQCPVGPRGARPRGCGRPAPGPRRRPHGPAARRLTAEPPAQGGGRATEPP